MQEINCEVHRMGIILHSHNQKFSDINDSWNATTTKYFQSVSQLYIYYQYQQ